MNLPESTAQMICFALYSASHAMTRAYGPLLKPLGLTYPQYAALTVLWEKDAQPVGAICKQLHMDTNVATPVLKRLEAMGHVTRNRDPLDERRVIVRLTESGRALRASAPDITRCIIAQTDMPLEELDRLVEQLSKLREAMQQ